MVAAGVAAGRELGQFPVATGRTCLLSSPRCKTGSSQAQNSGLRPKASISLDSGFRRNDGRKELSGNSETFSINRRQGTCSSSKRVGCGERSEPHRSRKPRLMGFPGETRGHRILGELSQETCHREREGDVLLQSAPRTARRNPNSIYVGRRSLHLPLIYCHKAGSVV